MRCTRNARLFVWIAVLFASVSIPLNCLTAQPEPPPPSAELLKRLGEAVDGYRSGGLVYVVATQRQPYIVFGVYPSRAMADSVMRAVRRAELAPAVFGPYASQADGPHAMAFISDTCAHINGSRLDCPPGTFFAGAAAQYVRAVDVDSVFVTVRLRNGDKRVIGYGPEVDALFFTPAAIDKFVIPYYVRIIGVDSAAALRRRLLSRLP